MSEVVWMLLLQALLIGLNAVFASAEIAVLSVSETKLAKLSEQGNKKAPRLMKLTRQPAKFLATIPSGSHHGVRIPGQSVCGR